jgi:predicted nucleotidyltransferase
MFRIGLFGSFVRGEETKESEIDILVEFEDPTFWGIFWTRECFYIASELW